MRAILHKGRAYVKYDGQWRRLKATPPSEKTMERWVSDGVAKAWDGCRVEPDGVCPHGKESWLIVLGYI